MNQDIGDPKSWHLLAPGHIAILKFPADHIPEDCRLATAQELRDANLGKPFPWGSLPEPTHASKLWHKHQIGVGGLHHQKWFVTKNGRFGGAANVPQTKPGSLRSSLLYDGGTAEISNQLAENEGFAIIKEVDPDNLNLWRKVQMHAAEHVAADGGHIVISPLDQTGKKAYVGFVGRCMTCPNPELISFKQLQKAVPNYEFELFDEWKGWSLVEASKNSELSTTAVK